MTKALLIITLILVTFTVGLYIGHRRTFPFGHFLRLKYFFVFLLQGTSRDTSSEEFVIDLRNKEDFTIKREQIARFIWGEEGLPLNKLPSSTSVTQEDSLVKWFRRLATAQQWVVRMNHDINSEILVFSPLQITQDVTLVYHQGHEGSAWAGRHLIRYFLKQGFQVMVVEMPLLGRNNQPVVNLRRHGAVRLYDHDYFRFLDSEFGGNSIRYFVEPVIVCINQLKVNGIDKIAMVGASGGGWTTTLCAALDERIDFSFSIAGSLPFNLRGKNELSDYENHLPSLYNVANYLELYLLAASTHGRLAIQILNKYDTVIFCGERGKKYEALVNDFLFHLGLGKFQCIIDSTWVGHGISPYAMKLIAAHLK